MDTLSQQTAHDKHPIVCHEHADEKFEFFNGERHAMGNTSFNHDLVKSYLAHKISRHFDDNQIHCRAIVEGRLHIGDNYFIPDIMVCKKAGEAAFSAPVVIVEVLSDGTRTKDYGAKFREYQKLETLEEYLVLEQDLMEARFFAKKDGWKGSVCVVGDVLPFASVGFAIAIEEIYKDVVLRKTDKI